MELHEEILQFWFGEDDDPYVVPDEISKRWFAGGPAFDELIRQRYADHLERAIRGEYDDWAATPRGRMALILIFDQFSRHLFRGSPRSWSQDLLAQKLAFEGLDDGVDGQLLPRERVFFYLPLEHAEDLVIQNLSVRKYEELRQETPDEYEGYSGYLDYAVKHQVIIERFGRFPHRNAVIGRPSTKEEAEFLTQPGSSF